jgi:hypothetical protein
MKSAWFNALAGIGIGMLLGIAVGLSSSPVIGVVVGAMGTGLLALLGLKDNTAIPNPAQALRLVGFGFACTVGLLVGLLLRTSDVLSPKLISQQEQWKSIGFSEDEAKKVVLYQRVGLLLPPLVTPPGNLQLAGKSSTSLFAGNSQMDVCSATNSSSFASTDEHLNALDQAGGRLREFANTLRGLKPDEQKRILASINHLACGS